MELVIRCSVCGLKMIIEEVESSKKHCAVVMHVSPCPCSSNLTKRAADVCRYRWGEGMETGEHSYSNGVCGKCGKRQ